ncbi:hypothetical protein CMO90_04440 [Candidatus Woesearchaeota archaeon]|jgi:ribosomal protein S18 acetylase RimI-like enzyme|nr:hypothetical protein [Candidatus Woesearchaeota archaeon]|tara:strand:- start:633 stop:1175 length:543 start_codon:yes stop_codon:yes gene_type:complete
MSKKTSFFEKIILFERNLKESIPEIKTKIPIKVKKATKKDAPLFKEIGFGNDARILTKKKFYSKIESGAKCFFVIHKKKIIGRAWISFSNNEKNLRLLHAIKKTDGYLSNAYVLKEYRNKGIHQRLLYERLEYLKKIGKKRAITIISKKNKASIDNISKIGFKPKKEFLSIRILNFSFII